MLRLIAMKSRPTVLASAVLALALLGDSLLYAALPLHAATFGISVAWAGVLLSANRITRLFAYPLLPRAAATFGLRRFTIAAAALGATSTLWFAAASGPWPLLAARVVWGIVFGALSLAALAYATEPAGGAGARVGVSLSLRELGPIASLTAGMLLVATAGMRPTLLVLGAVSLVAVPAALALPRAVAPIAPRARHAPLDRRIVLSATMGFVADGLFPATIAVLLLESRSASAAAIAAGMILALKRAAVVIFAPLSGHAADRFGALPASVAGCLVAAAGTLLIATGHAIAGATVLAIGAAVAATAIPLLAAGNDAHDRLSSLARLGFARDAGAAAGPLIALALLERIGGSLLYGIATIALVATALLARFFTCRSKLEQHPSGTMAHAQQAIESVDRVHVCSRAPALHPDRDRTDEQLHRRQQRSGESGLQRCRELARDTLADTEERHSVRLQPLHGLEQMVQPSMRSRLQERPAVQYVVAGAARGRARGRAGGALGRRLWHVSRHPDGR